MTRTVHVVGAGLAGLSAATILAERGEKVVVSGQFLIDSEASLSSALDRLNDPAATPAPATTAPMSGMPMQGDHP